MATVVHYCPDSYRDELRGEPNTWARCGRWVPLERAYDENREVTCRACRKILYREDLEDLAEHVRRHG